MQQEKILSIRKDHALLKKYAQRYADQEKLEQAASYAVNAVRTDYSDRESRYLLAQIYRMMERFGRSNDLLAPLVTERSEEEAEYWYLMGCNYVDMQMLGSARDCLKMCLALEPDFATQQDAEDLLEPLREYYEGDEEDRTMWLLQQAARRGARLFTAGRFEEALSVLHYVDMIEPLFMDTRNYVSRTLWQLGREKEAVMASSWILERYPKDVLALCNLAFYAHEAGQEEQCDRYLERLAALSFDRDMEAADDLLEVAQAFFRCGRYPTALEYARRYRALCAYEEEGMHLEAASRYMLGQYDEAQRIWATMCRIDDTDAASDHYRRICIRQRDGENAPKAKIPYRHRLEKETLTKMFRRSVSEKASGAKTQLNAPGTLSLLTAMIECGIMETHVLPAIASDESPETLDLLRGMLMRDIFTDAQMQWICAAVHMRLGDTACFIDHEDAVHTLLLRTRSESVSQREEDLEAVRTMFLSGSEGVLAEADRKGAEALLHEFSRRLRRWYPIRFPEAFAAALEYYYCSRHDMESDKHLCIRRYGTDTRSFNQALARIVRVLARQPEE